MFKLLSAAASGLLALCSATVAQEVDQRYDIPLKSGAFQPPPVQRPSTSLREPADAAAAPGIRLFEEPGAERPAAAPAGPETATEQRRVILQFDRLPSQTQIEALRQEGTVLHDYLGGNSYYATTPSSPEVLATQDETIRSVAPLDVQQKLDPRLVERRSAAGETGNAQQEIRVQLWEDSEFEEVSAQIQGLGAVIIDDRPSFSSVTVLADERVLDAIARLPDVKFLAPAPPPKQRFNDGVRRNINSDVLYVAPYELDGSGTRVGVWDGGKVESGHLDFDGRLTVVDSHAPTDDHATHVVGTLGGSGARSLDFQEEQQLEELLVLSDQPQPGAIVATEEEVVQPVSAAEMRPTGFEKQWQGVAPGTHIFSYFWDEADEEHRSAIEDNEIQVSQNSWGFRVSSVNCDEYGDYTDDSAAYDEIVTGLFGRRIPVVFAAGNERNDRDCGLADQPPFINYRVITPPVTAKDIITVGAINSDDGTMTEFSSWGPDDAGRIKPDVVAPGCEFGGDGTVTSTVPPNGYGGSCGTSMAAPAVSGTILLILEQYDKRSSADPIPSSLKALLLHGAEDWGPPGPDYQSGYGAVSAPASVDLVRENKVTESSIDTTGQVKTAMLDIPPDTRQLKVTLVWDDPPGAPASEVPLVNDLDLELRSPLDEPHLPWVLDPDHPEQPAQRGVDRVNVMEQVLADAPEPGAWRIHIRGQAVAKPPQPFSLVVTAVQ